MLLVAWKEEIFTGLLWLELGLGLEYGKEPTAREANPSASKNVSSKQAKASSLSTACTSTDSGKGIGIDCSDNAVVNRSTQPSVICHDDTTYAIEVNE